MNRTFLSLLLSCFFSCVCANGQLFFAAPAQFGNQVGSGLFIEQNGQVAQLPTGLVEHNFPLASRDARFIVFSSPDPVEAPLQVPPSSDIYIFDRLISQTRRVVDHTTLIVSPNEVDSFTPVSAALSPNNQLLAYGVMLTRREGLANPRSTRELNIARASDGLIVANPTFGRGPVSDAFQAEFAGIAWDPAGTSFVTPTYATVASQSGGVVQLPAIVRFLFDSGSGNWFPQVLSTPRYFDAQFPIAAETHIFPTISPSGAGLAYWHLTWPDALGSSRGVTARVVIANSDGSNARFLAVFNEGFYPLGLAWAPDGNSLVVSFAQQTTSGGAFLPSANAGTAVIRAISTADGSISSVPGVNAGFFPSFGVVSSSVGSLQGVRLQMQRSQNGSLLLTASGVDPNSTYSLQSSSQANPGTFNPPQTFTGAQLLQGIELNLPDSQRFFRLIRPDLL